MKRIRLFLPCVLVLAGCADDAKHATGRTGADGGVDAGSQETSHDAGGRLDGGHHGDDGDAGHGDGDHDAGGAPESDAGMPGDDDAGNVPRTTPPVLFTPADGDEHPGCSYTRIIRLEHQADAQKNGRLLATFEYFSAFGFPIHESRDDGRTWTVSPIAKVVEADAAANEGFKLRWQPDLFELPQAIGNLPAGAILLAGDSLADAPFRQRVQLYVSLDQGHTWSYRSTITASDPNVSGGIWEPNIQVTSDGRLIVYYSDEQHSDQKYNQLLAHRVSPDGGLTWGPEVYDVAVPDGNLRPGMAVVKRLPNGGYVMSFELVNGGAGSPAHVKRSSDGMDWGDAASVGDTVQAAHGAYVGATPYIAWIPSGSPQGMLIASGMFTTNSRYQGPRLFFNTNYGQGAWEEMPPAVAWAGGNDHAGWSQGMLASADGQSFLQAVSSDIGGGTNQILYSQKQTPRSSVESGSVYNLTNVASGQCIDVPMGSHDVGLGIAQYMCNNLTPQEFRIDALGDGSYRFTNTESNLALTHAGAGAGTQIVQQPAGDGQRFSLHARSDGAFDIIAVETNLALDIPSGSDEPGAHLQLWDRNDATAQGFRLWKVR